MGRAARLRRKKKQNILNNLYRFNLSHDDTLINLISWLKTHNWKPVSRLCPTEFPLTGRGLMARKTILANDILVRIPLDAMITSKTFDESNFSQILEHKAFLSQEIFAAFLIWEKNKSGLSSWAPYINTLPCDFRCVLGTLEGIFYG